MLPPSLVVPAVLDTIRPALLALPVLLVLKPLILILCPVRMDALALAVSHVIQPFAFVEVSVSIIEFPVTASTIEPGVAIVAAAIWPMLNPNPITKGPPPFARVDSAFRKGRRRQLYSL